MTAGAIED